MGLGHRGGRSACKPAKGKGSERGLLSHITPSADFPRERQWLGLPVPLKGEEGDFGSNWLWSAEEGWLDLGGWRSMAGWTGREGGELALGLVEGLSEPH